MKKRILAILLLVVMVFCIASCSEEDDDNYYYYNGGTHAFKTFDNMIVTAPSTPIIYATYYLPTNYRTALRSAAAKASAITSKITIRTDDSRRVGLYYSGVYDGSVTPWYEFDENAMRGKTFLTNSQYWIKTRTLKAVNSTVEYKNMGDAVAFNVFDYTSNAVVKSSYIFFNTSYMGTYTLAEIEHIALHELGHTMGLRDVYQGSEVYNRSDSVMICPTDIVFTDYTDFDKRCIRDVYGD